MPKRRDDHQSRVTTPTPRRKRIIPFLLAPIEVTTDEPPVELGSVQRGSKIEMRLDAASVACIARWLEEGAIRWCEITPAERLAASKAAIEEHRHG